MRLCELMIGRSLSVEHALQTVSRVSDPGGVVLNQIRWRLVFLLTQWS